MMFHSRAELTTQDFSLTAKHMQQRQFLLSLFFFFCASVFWDAECVALFQRNLEKYAYLFVTSQMRRLMVMFAQICSILS